MIDLRFGDDELRARRDHVVEFVRDQVREAGVDGAVLGLSGGVDSSLVAYLAVEALGPENLHGLVMPGEVSSDDNMSDAEMVAQQLEIEYDVVEIRPMVAKVLDAFPEARGDDVAVGNARARMRAVVNYLVANHENRLVLGTGNRSEAQVGYYTKYGDGAVDCHPIGNLYKAQVRQMASAVGVPEVIVEKPSTAGLWAGQTDREELGMSYETLDQILAVHVDGPLTAAASERLLDVDRETIDRVRDLHERSEHKREMPPSPDPI